MILYPIFATSIGLDHQHAGVFIGGTIHDVAQVVGAGYIISPETGDIATYVKLLRVTMRNLRAKLAEATPGRTFVATEYGLGYRFLAAR